MEISSCFLNIFEDKTSELVKARFDMEGEVQTSQS